MTRRVFDPRRLDVADLAQHGQSVGGQWAMAELPRLQQSQQPPQDAMSAPVQWGVRGERRTVTGDEPQLWLHLQASTSVWLSCQRCLHPMRVELSVERPIRFVRGEDRAEALDAECDDDVLALSASLDLLALVEDELILALPIVPRHELCPSAVATIVPAAAAEANGVPLEKPFAALEALKRRRPGGAAEGGG